MRPARIRGNFTEFFVYFPEGGFMRQDILYALRQLRRNPGFAAIALCVIALGIGANTAMFSVIDAVILKPLPYANPERLVMLWETRPDQGFGNNVVSGANYLEWRARAKSFDAMSAMVVRSVTLTGAAEPEEIRVQMVAEDFFPMLGISMSRGRIFVPEECKPGAPATVILSDGLWRRKFSADPSIVGKTIRLNGNAATIVGVAPPQILTVGDRPPDLWLALGIRGFGPTGARASGRNYSVLARLRPGVAVERADLEMRAIARQLEQEYTQANAHWSAKAVPLASEVYGKVQTPLLVLMGAVAFILLIACTNVANLLLARAAARQREMAIRASLGAARGRLARQMLIESATLALAGSILGVTLAYGLIQALKAFGPADVRRLDHAAVNGSVLLFTAGVTLLTGLGLGLAPALLAAGRALRASLGEGGRGSSSGTHANRLRDAFTIAQVTFALMLLVGAGLLLRSFVRLIDVEPGFRTDHVFTMNLSLPGTRYRDSKDVQFIAELVRRMRALPGVINASAITFLPFKGYGSATYYWRSDRPRPAPGQEAVTDVRMVQPQYFETMNVPLRQGRTFEDGDNDAKAPLRFVINEALARQMFPGENPIGKQLVVLMKNENPPGEIIGVVGDLKHVSLAERIRPTVYYAQAQLSFGWATVVAYTSVPPLSLSRAASDVVHQMDPELPVSEVGTMQRWVDESLTRTKFQTALLTVFAGLALVLAVLGIYGVMSYGVAQRTKEIGVRVALGAQKGQLARMILSRALTLTLAGLALGLTGAVILGRYLKTLLFEIKPADPVTLAAVAALLLAVALAAALIPAARATRVDPMVVLRYE
jgi:putative ABC transport system permease protein